MIGNLWTVEDISKHCRASYGMVSQVCRRDGIEPIGRACRVRLFMSHQVELIAAGLANRRPYAGQPRYTVEEMGDSPRPHQTVSDLIAPLPGVGHTSALGIAIETNTDEDTAQAAIDAAGVKPAHIEPTGEQMYLDEQAAPIVAALKAK